MRPAKAAASLALILLLSAFLGRGEDPVSVYYSEGTEKAVRLYEEKAEKSQLDTQDLYDLGCLYREMGQNKKAYGIYSLILAKSSLEVRARFELAKMDYFNGNLAEADAGFKKLSDEGAVNWEVKYWHGCVLLESGDYAGASLKFDEALDFDQNKNIVYIKIAENCLAQGDLDGAAKFYDKALKADRTYSELNKKIARIYEKKGEAMIAYVRWKNYGEVEGNDIEAVAKVDAYMKKNEAVKQKVAEFEKQKEEKRTAYIPPGRAPVENAGEITPVRVGLLRDTDTIHLKFGGPASIISEDGSTLLELKALDDCTFIFDEKKKTCTIRLAGSRSAEFKGSVNIIRKQQDSTTRVYDVAHGKGFYWAERKDTTYRGDFTVRCTNNGLTLVNNLNMEEYLYSVTPSEIPPYWHAEALKAQAVSARTYAFSHMRSHGKSGFDLCASQHCGVYSGIANEDKRTTDAVNTTRGEVLSSPDEEFVSTFYSHCCGGHTNDVSQVWGMKKIRTLRGVLDAENSKWKFPLTPFMFEEWVRSFPEAYCRAKGEGETSYRWIRYLSAEDLKYYAGNGVGKIKSITVLERTSAGAVTKVEIEGQRGKKRVKFDPIRNTLGKIRSNVIKWEYRIDAEGYIKDIYIYGAGWGHGVGLCQRGSRGMAEKGKDYKTVLTHYYPGSFIIDKYK